ncbi:glutathione S-transferase family protein [Croceicoccus marinus]|jgi:glutathione S-transferase|uniref:Glutathione S-transferase family protein n=1 Tax=Croceicoccus marinus TaxID=450378 RepID=A0A7G6VTH8_9SPHN|nr:glutathione S-transferase family protein [Croceicoccus marinus]QNE05043.1 glutathione S-transferase family protein [Croceicoccus marinus]
MPIAPDAPIEITGYNWVPPFARGFVRDLRARWFCEETGLPYRERLISAVEKPADWRSEQPFGQVPVLRDGDIHLFESGAILLHLAERTGRLLPATGQARATALSWLFAAYNSVEPVQNELAAIEIFHAGEEWARLRRADALKNLDRRHRAVATALGAREWLAGEFSIADIAMVSVLRSSESMDTLGDHPVLAGYLERGTGRPAFRQALADQLAGFDERFAPRMQTA